jgi:hypothetical protein
MADFDPIKALSEEIQGLNDVLHVLSVQVRSAEAKMTEAEHQYGMAVKLRGFAQDELSRKQRVLAHLREQQQ